MGQLLKSALEESWPGDHEANKVLLDPASRLLQILNRMRLVEKSTVFVPFVDA